jgi:hypothetical protein
MSQNPRKSPIFCYSICTSSQRRQQHIQLLHLGNYKYDSLPSRNEFPIFFNIYEFISFHCLINFSFVLSVPNLGFSNINCMEIFQSTEF